MWPDMYKYYNIIYTSTKLVFLIEGEDIGEGEDMGDSYLYVAIYGGG